MTTDMSERVRMRKLHHHQTIRNSYMRAARARKIVKRDNWQEDVRHFVREAREANRQAVRLWYRRTTRS